MHHHRQLCQQRASNGKTFERITSKFALPCNEGNACCNTESHKRSHLSCQIHFEMRLHTSFQTFSSDNDAIVIGQDRCDWIVLFCLQAASHSLGPRVFLQVLGGLLGVCVQVPRLANPFHACKTSLSLQRHFNDLSLRVLRNLISLRLFFSLVPIIHQKTPYSSHTPDEQPRMLYAS